LDPNGDLLAFPKTNKFPGTKNLPKGGGFCSKIRIGNDGIHRLVEVEDNEKVENLSMLDHQA
jgi:hypothetical protein